MQLAVEQNVGTIIIGQNRGWKQHADMGKRNNQAFCHIPHHLLISMIRYKAAEQGIDVQLTEEAYTSQASFLDHDPLPRYEEGKDMDVFGKADPTRLISKPKRPDQRGCERCGEYFTKSNPGQLRLMG